MPSDYKQCINRIKTFCRSVIDPNIYNNFLMEKDIEKLEELEEKFNAYQKVFEKLQNSMGIRLDLMLNLTENEAKISKNM